jgi:hypothetical protein
LAVGSAALKQMIRKGFCELVFEQKAEKVVKGAL